MTSLRRAVGKNRGVAILLTLFFMILLSLIGIALIGLVPVELRSATRTKLDLQAHYTVTSGIRHARAWCSAVMTPTSTTSGTSPDDLGDNPITVDSAGTAFYYAGASRINDITGVNGAAPEVEYQPMRLSAVYGSGLIPTTNANWPDVYKMLNIPASGIGAVDPNTVVLVKKAPLTLGDWTAYSVIIPDADTPGGARTQDAAHKITTFFGGAGKAGRRCYQIVCIGFYQGFPTLRGKSTVLEDSFARYSLFVDSDPTGGWVLQALPGQTTTLGPVHTNGTFKFGINPAVWGQSATDPIPFNGLMTFGQYADPGNTTVVASLNHDGAIYSQGNDINGQGTQYRPFDNGGNDPSGRYNKMIAGGKSNLRQTASVNLPPDSSKLANAAFGSDFTTGPYTQPAIVGHVKSGGTDPDGIFVFPNTSGKAAGGIVIKGDQQNMFLEVVATDLKPVTNTASLESGNAVGNPGVRVQASKSTTGLVTTTFSGPTSTMTTITNTGAGVVTTWSTNITQSSSTARTTITNTAPVTQYSTKLNPTVSSSTATNYYSTINTVWSTFLTSKSNTTYSTGTSLTTIGGAGGLVQTITLYGTSTVSAMTSTSTKNTTTTSTGITPSTWTVTGTTLISTGVSTSTGSVVSTLYGTTIFPSTTTGTSTPTGVTSSMVTFTTSGTVVSTVTFKPIDQVIEVKNVGISLNPTMFKTITGTNTPLYNRPAGAHTGNNAASNNPGDMDVSKLSGITELLLANGNSLTTLGATTIPTGNVVVIKQSRLDPSKAIVFIVPATPNTDGDLLNGAVYSEGHIGIPGDPLNATAANKPGTKGIAGVNMGRKTIGTQIQSASATNSGDLFDKQFAKPSTSIGIVNNLFQFGTKRRENDANLLKADNGLGLVSENIRVTADPDAFTNFWSGGTPNYTSDNFLNIHAVLLGGSQTQGGLTVNGFQDINRITQSNLGASTTAQTPLIRFVGGLILRNYYGRVNAVTQAGWMSKNLYNQQLALKPPPYFPNNGLLLPLGYMEERIWAEQKI